MPPVCDSLWILAVAVALSFVCVVSSWAPPHHHSSGHFQQGGLPSHCSEARSQRRATGGEEEEVSSLTKDDLASSNDGSLFDEFVRFLQLKQTEIINMLEEVDGSGAKFCNDTWGIFAADDRSRGGKRTLGSGSGGITRVIQGGDVIEKGACSFTLIQGGTLSSERAATIRSRQDGIKVGAGDSYSAAALSIVLHSKSPMVPTFRSDVRIFSVLNGEERSLSWFGGGADLTPYYLFEDDIIFFHRTYKSLCDEFNNLEEENSGTFLYETMKKACDEYFYLPARSEHRGTGGIFFDDMTATPRAMDFVQRVADSWMPSWLPIVEKRRNMDHTETQRQWQLLRRGRYLEFNLLYDRGVKFGLANANPRVEGVMVSAPPLIAWEYNHPIEEDSEEATLTKILKTPREWV